MRKFFLRAAMIAAVVLPIAAIATTYTQTIMNDGTTTWTWTSSSAVLTLNGTASGLFSVDGTAGLILPIGIVSALPSCTTALKGAQRVVSDASSPTYNATVTGSSTTIVNVYCNGTNWLSH